MKQNLVLVDYWPQIATALLLGESPVTSSDEAKRTGGNGSISAFMSPIFCDGFPGGK